MVEDVPLDYKHLVLLGVTRKLLVGTWIFVKPPYNLAAIIIKSMNSLIKHIDVYVPSESPKKSRSVSESRRWKPFLTKEKYDHFLYIFVSFKILISSSLIILYDYAGRLLSYSAQETQIIYDPDYMSHSFHNSYRF